MSVDAGGHPSTGPATFASLDPLVRPRSVAVVGASDDPTGSAAGPIAYMKAQGFQGSVWPVNPRRERVQGLPAFASVSALPEAPDAAIVAVPVEAALEAVEELGRKGCKAVIAFTAGFAEVDEAGARAQAALVDRARAHGMRLLGPNCLGLFNAGLGYFPIFSSSFENGWPLPGRIGIASQSGAFGTHLFAVARDRGLGTPILVTTGNEAEVALGDVIGWMAQAPEIDVIAAYAEGIRESERFLAALDLARRNLQAGGDDEGRPLGPGRPRGEVPHRVHSRRRRRDAGGAGGVRRAPRPHDRGAARRRLRRDPARLPHGQHARRRHHLRRRRRAHLGRGGGGGPADAADAGGGAGAAQGAGALLRPAQPGGLHGAGLQRHGLIGKFASSMVEDGGYRSVLAFFTQLGASPSVAPALRAQLKAVMDRHPDRVWVLSIVAPEERIREYEADGFLVFEDATRAVVALHAMGKFGEAFAAAARQQPCRWSCRAWRCPAPRRARPRPSACWPRPACPRCRSTPARTPWPRSRRRTGSATRWC
jgi:succinyl-CoA synthetase alpha subunit